MVGGSWKYPLSQAEFSAWLSCKYLLLSHLCCSRTGIKNPKSLAENDGYMPSIHLEKKRALERRKQLIPERKKNLSMQLQDNLGPSIVTVLNPPEPFLLECCGPFGRIRNALHEQMEPM